MSTLPTDATITYQRQYRTCGKSCKTCRDGKGHGPYWYAYWRTPGDAEKLHSKYIGKQKPESRSSDDVDSTGHSVVSL